MAYIGCRNCESPDCKGCNLKNLETMLNNGKFDCLMNENRCINPSADVAPVRHGRWELTGADKRGRGGNWKCNGRDGCGKIYPYKCDYCPNCGAKMDGGTQNEQS